MRVRLALRPGARGAVRHVTATARGRRQRPDGLLRGSLTRDRSRAKCGRRSSSTSTLPRDMAAFIGCSPDTQVFLALHAHTPTQRPTEPMDVLVSLLLLTMVAPDSIPLSLKVNGQLRRAPAVHKRPLVSDDAALPPASRPADASADLAIDELAQLRGCSPLATGTPTRKLHHHTAWTCSYLIASTPPEPPSTNARRESEYVHFGMVI